MRVDSTNYEIQSPTGETLAEVSNGELNVKEGKEENVVGLTSLGMVVSGSALESHVPTAEGNVVSVPAGESVVSNTTGGSLHVTSVDGDSSVDVTTNAGKVSSSVNAETEECLAAVYAGATDTYTVTFKNGTEGSITLQGGGAQAPAPTTSRERRIGRKGSPIMRANGGAAAKQTIEMRTNNEGTPEIALNNVNATSVAVAVTGASLQVNGGTIRQVSTVSGGSLQAISASSNTDTTNLSISGNDSGTDISTLDAALAVTSASYTGSVIEPEVFIYDGAHQLVPGTDYTVLYKANTNAGTATVTVYGIGSYKGTVNLTFEITPAPVDPDDGGNNDDNGGGNGGWIDNGDDEPKPEPKPEPEPEPEPIVLPGVDPTDGKTPAEDPVTSIVKNPDGTITEITTVKNTDGSETRIEKTEGKDGSVTEKTTVTETNGDFKERIVETDANGKMSVETSSKTTDEKTKVVTETKDTWESDGSTTEYEKVTEPNKDYKETFVAKDPEGNPTETKEASRETDAKGTVTEKSRVENENGILEKESVTKEDGSGSISETKTVGDTVSGSTVTFGAEGKAEKISTLEQQGEEKSTVEYQVGEKGSLTLRKVETTGTEVVIPSEIKAADGKVYVVVAIGKNILKECAGVTQLVLPETVKKILPKALKKAKDLRGLTVFGGTKFGSNSLKGTSKNLTIWVIGSKKDVKAIRKQMKKAGNRKARVRRLEEV